MLAKKCIEEVCPELFIDGWKLKDVDEVDTDSFTVEDEYDGLVNMESVQQEKYLGDILTSDGKNTGNITARKNRGICVVNQIMTILGWEILFPSCNGPQKLTFDQQPVDKCRGLVQPLLYRCD